MSKNRGSELQLNMLKSVLGSIALVLVVLGVGAAIGYKKYLMMTTLPPDSPEQPEVVVFATPKIVPSQNTTTTVGTILAPRSIQLRTEVVGTVSKMSFKPGELVTQGQDLLKLDASVEEAQLEGAIATMDLAASTLKRTQDAAKLRAISELELEQAAAIMLQAKADVSRLKSIIRKKTLKAPFDARAGLFDVQVGQYLPEGTQITMLQGIDNFVYIDFMIPQQAADDLHVGDEIRLAMQPRNYHPKIIAVDSQADRNTSNVLARAKLDDPPASMCGGRGWSYARHAGLDFTGATLGTKSYTRGCDRGIATQQLLGRDWQSNERYGSSRFVDRYRFKDGRRVYGSHCLAKRWSRYSIGRCRESGNGLGGIADGGDVPRSRSGLCFCLASARYE